MDSNLKKNGTDNNNTNTYKYMFTAKQHNSNNTSKRDRILLFFDHLSENIINNAKRKQNRWGRGK